MTANPIRSDSPTPKTSSRWRWAFGFILALWVTSSTLLTNARIRAWVSTPLHVSNLKSKADVAYVMSGGHAYWERLQAASDLYNMGQIQQIAIQNNPTKTQYDFVQKKTLTMTQRATRFLDLHGVPEHSIVVGPKETGSVLGSWQEAKAFAAEFPTISRLVVVTSSPHTRRSLMCFRRAMPEACEVSVFAASRPEHGAELFNPIWLEYGKLMLYWVAAR